MALRASTHAMSHRSEEAASPDAAASLDVEPKKADPVPVPAGESSLPLIQSAALAATYMFGSILFFLLIRYSKLLEKNGGDKYDSAAAVFFTELAKLLFSIGAMYYRTGKFLPVSVFKDKSYRIGIYYAVPSAIYAVYNNLTYLNLTLFDAGTYQVFMQTRVLFTGVLYCYILKRSLSHRKWLGLLILTVGVASKYISWDLQIDSRVLFMLFQASLSAFAGVYNEFLLKRDISMDVNEQNFFMYSFALFFNLGGGLVKNPEYYLSGQVFHHLSGILFWIVITGATVGIVTSLILKFINVIVKVFASACVGVLTAVFASVLFWDVITSMDIEACFIVMGSIYVYFTDATDAERVQAASGVNDTVSLRVDGTAGAKPEPTGLGAAPNGRRCHSAPAAPSLAKKKTASVPMRSSAAKKAGGRLREEITSAGKKRAK